MQVFDRLVSKGATVIVIEHDLDVIRNVDYIIDMGPGEGEAGGRIIATGTPEEIVCNKESITEKYLRWLLKTLLSTFQQNLQCSILNYPFARRHGMAF